MDIKGIQKTSLVDYPDRISSVIFFGGCNFACGFCHNPDLVRGYNNLPSYPAEEVLEFLKNRSSLIGGVVITGGEPTLYKDIEVFIQRIKEIPLQVKIDTNGSSPRIVENLLNKNLINYAAVDIKTSPGKYELAAGVKIDPLIIKSTVDLLKNSGIDYELRTTCVPSIVELNDFLKIKEFIGQVKRYYLQQFVNKTTLDAELIRCSPYLPSVLSEFKEVVKTFADICEIRGV